jgi:hypothetical protein
VPSFIRTEKDERLWPKAKARAKEEGKAKDWAYITGIYKKMHGGKVAAEHLADRWLTATSAVEKYDSWMATIQQDLGLIRRLLDQHEKQFKTRQSENWGYVSDLEHVEENLGPLVRFLHSNSR